jgi:hypothetical protein
MSLAAILPLGTHVSASTASDLPDWIPFGSLVAAAALLFGLFINRHLDRRDRRRSLYSDAYQAAVGWGELYYRVRRRDPAALYEVAARFHEVQEQIDFHQSWIDSESVALGRAYCRLVLRTKALTLQPIRDAWAEPPALPADGFSVAPVAPVELGTARELFISDLRDHLSWWPPRRLALRCRYTKKKWAAIQVAVKDITTDKKEDR